MDKRNYSSRLSSPVEGLARACRGLNEAAVHGGFGGADPDMQTKACHISHGQHGEHSVLKKVSQPWWNVAGRFALHLGGMAVLDPLSCSQLQRPSKGEFQRHKKIRIRPEIATHKSKRCTTQKHPIPNLSRRLQASRPRYPQCCKVKESLGITACTAHPTPSLNRDQ
jgi:hypothetical protein